MKDPQQYLTFANRTEWRAWLEAHHDSEREVWLLLYKKKAGIKSLTLEEAVEEALCFGWIDGILKPVDEEKYLLRYSPRQHNSVWSEINKQRAERLIAEGCMTPAGLAKIDEAKQTGEWEAASSREDVDRIPPDLEQELRSNESTFEAFEKWSVSKKKQYLYWVTSAKKAETRQKRIRAIIEMARKKE